MRSDRGCPPHSGGVPALSRGALRRHPAGAKLADVVAFGTQAAAGPAAAVRGTCAAPILGGAATRSLPAVARHVERAVLAVAAARHSEPPGAGMALGRSTNPAAMPRATLAPMGSCHEIGPTLRILRLSTPRWQEYQQWQQYQAQAQAYQYWAATGMQPPLPYAPAYDLQHWSGGQAPCAATPAAAYGQAPSTALSAPANLQPLRDVAKPRQKALSSQNVGAVPQRPGSSGVARGCGHGAHTPRRGAAGSVADRFAQQESDRQQGHLQQLDQRQQQQLRVARRPDG